MKLNIDLFVLKCFVSRPEQVVNCDCSSANCVDK